MLKMNIVKSNETAINEIRNVMNKVLDIEKGMKEMKENNETAQETQKEDLMVNQTELK